jgi:hypothetical protein
MSAVPVRAPYAQPGEPSVHAAPGDAGGFGVPRSPYLVVDEVAARLRCSKASVHELTRTCAVPHRKLPGTRRCLFLEAELEAWEAGAVLEVVELPRGGRIVRPVGVR